MLPLPLTCTSVLKQRRRGTRQRVAARARSVTEMGKQGRELGYPNSQDFSAEDPGESRRLGANLSNSPLDWEARQKAATKRLKGKLECRLPYIVGKQKSESKVSQGRAPGARAKRKSVRSHQDHSILNSPWPTGPE